MTVGQEMSSEKTSQQEMPDSMWQLKPWWCQPWSIILTGIAIPVASWLLLHRLWITLPVAGVIAVWWLLFLVIVPGQYSQMLKANEQSR
ncbi:MAG: DUF6737 family protein [Cyanobacteria bacterium J06635_11]